MTTFASLVKPKELVDYQKFMYKIMPRDVAGKVQFKRVMTKYRPDRDIRLPMISRIWKG